MHYGGIYTLVSDSILENMSRTFKEVDYEQARDLTVRLGDCLPPEHWVRFVVDSVAQLNLSELYATYGVRGGEPYTPEMLLGLLLYGYATGIFSSRKIERATDESVAFRFIAGTIYPDHYTRAVKRRTFLPELKDLFVQVLLLAQETEPYLERNAGVTASFQPERCSIADRLLPTGRLC